MSEPRAVAAAVRELLPGILHFGVHDERVDFPSEAFAVGDGGAATLIDPLPLADECLDAIGPIEAIVLSVRSHQRAAWRYRRLTRAPVHAPRGLEPLDETPDLSYGDDEVLPGGLRAIHAPGPCGSHHVLFLEREPGALFLGDLLVREGEAPPRFLADDYMQDRLRARHSARRLLDYRFEALLFGHGPPILEGGRRVLEDLLEAEARRVAPA